MGAMDGKVVVITGGNSGIGKEAAIALAGMGARVAITARNAEKGAKARAEIVHGANVDPTNVDVVALDLASLASVRDCATELLDRYDRLDVLLNNAGGTLSARQVTQDGFEMTFGVNHLGHFLLTNLLLDRLKASAPSRVITVASMAHQYARAGLDFDDLQCERTRYRGMLVYGRSKLANILFANELARRLDGTGVTSNSVHPGWVATNFSQEGDTRFMGFFSKLARPLAISPERGADTLVYLASSPDVDGVTGQYFSKRAVAKSTNAAKDDAAARRLWDVSEQLVGLTPAT